MDDLTEWKHARLQGRTAAALWGLQKVENHLARCDEQSSAWRIKYSGTRDQNQNNPFLASAAIWIPSKHTAQAMSPSSEAAAPSGATDAVLKPSEPVPADAKEVRGIDFNQYAHRSITVEELIAGYSTMGFQATSVGEAVRIINDMVSRFVLPAAAAFERGDSR